MASPRWNCPELADLRAGIEAEWAALRSELAAARAELRAARAELENLKVLRAADEAAKLASFSEMPTA
jgi:hypothetical protein